MRVTCKKKYLPQYDKINEQLHREFPAKETNCGVTVANLMYNYKLTYKSAAKLMNIYGEYKRGVKMWVIPYKITQNVDFRNYVKTLKDKQIKEWV